MKEYMKKSLRDEAGGNGRSLGKMGGEFVPLFIYASLPNTASVWGDLEDDVFEKMKRERERERINEIEYREWQKRG
ncbi:hypothetical protein B9Z55_016745 [Caenorhabditis nigoni]|uniref:Uncharacterized protein n=1 Tax=Caenorhabditis nigoni TaxID=1611254 RepID=A0A2G5T6V0_9PELO|nr:hypothetical protein B9Z55_016745 [Caenorhabditis nigoni]